MIPLHGKVALLSLREGNISVTKGPLVRSQSCGALIFQLVLKTSNKQPSCWWFETPGRSGDIAVMISVVFFQLLRAWSFWWQNHIFAFPFLSAQWNWAGSWNPSSWKTIALLLLTWRYKEHVVSHSIDLVLEQPGLSTRRIYRALFRLGETETRPREWWNKFPLKRKLASWSMIVYFG